MISACILVAIWAAGNFVTAAPAEILRMGDAAEFFAAASAYVDAHPPGEGETFDLSEDAVVRSGSARLLLVDAIGSRISEIGPAKVAEWSMKRAGASGSVAERILQIRNTLRASSEAGDFARGELRGLLADPALADCRGPVVAQVFDGIVFLGDAGFVPDLEKALKNRALEIGAAQALDRLADRVPVAVMRALNDSPEILKDRPLLRADLFTKSSLTDPAARAEFERYLARDDVPLPAKEKSICELLQPGHMLVVGIFTGAGRSGGSDKPRVTSGILREWLARPAMAPLHPVIRECLSVRESL